MITLLKLAGVSALLSAGVVTAIDPTVIPAPVSTKIFHDRLPSEPVSNVVLADASGTVQVAATTTTDCKSQAWPYVSGDCVAKSGEAGARKPVRTITIERRDAPNTSTLVRIPVAGTN